MHLSMMRRVMPLGLLLALTSQAWAFEVGVVPATRKILPDTVMPTATSIALEGARGEWEGLQIVVRHAAGALDGINVEMSDLTSSTGDKILASTMVLYREYDVNVTLSSAGTLPLHERKAGLYPDPLIPFVDPYTANRQVGAPFALASAETGVVWVDIPIPAAAKPGDYVGTARVMAQGQSDVTLNVSFHVWDIDLSTRHTVATAYGYSYDKPAGYHGGPSGPDATLSATLQKRYLEALHQHRIDPGELPAGLSFSFDASGNMNPVDWDTYDAAVGPFLTGAYFADGQPVNRFNVDLGQLRPGSGGGGLTDEQFKTAARAYAEHMKAKGWWNQTYIYSSDEPYLNGGDATFAQIKHDAALLIAASDLWRGHVLVTSYYVESLRDEVGIWCPVTQQYETWFWGEGKPGRADYAPLLAEGKELWFYVCNADFPPYAGYDIDTAIGYEPRIAKWGTYFEHASGFLYWRTTYWVDDDPWNKLSSPDTFTRTGARNGDGFLFYPGDHNGSLAPKGSPADISIDGPIVSYRMKQIRDGFEDWELFRLAGELGGETYTREQVNRAYKRFGDMMVESCNADGTQDGNFYCRTDQPWTLDENLLAEVRHNIAAKVLFLQNPSAYPDPEASDDSDSDSEASEDGDTAEGDSDSAAASESPDGDTAEAESEASGGSSGGCSQTSAAPWWLALLAVPAWRRRERSTR